MSRISQRTIDAVTDLDIVSVIEKYNIDLKRSGSSLTACCPFHNERTPSFSVSRRRNIYKCFSCGKGGGPVQFVMEHEGLEYREAVKTLAKDHNIIIEYDKDERTSEQVAADKKRETLRIALEVAQQFFVEQFYADTDEAKIARQYAFSRWDEEYCKEFGIGYAPKDSRLFLDFIRNNSISIDTMLEVGLLGKNKETGKLYTSFRQRVTLPVRTRSRTLTTFSARYIGDNPDILKRSKYLNLSDSLLFNKSETLFGIDVAARAARDSNNFVVVEGGPDVMRLQIIGIQQAVAPMGTALSVKHLELMKRICTSICFIPDSDAPKNNLYGPGVNAVMKNGLLALEQGFDVSVKEIPRTEKDDENEVKYDADSYITSKEVFLQLESEPFVVWYAKKRLQGASTSELQAEVIAEVAALMININDENLRELYIDKLSRLVGKKKMWQDSIKRARRKNKEVENEKEDCAGIPPHILASLRRCNLILRNGCYHATDDNENLNRCSNFMVDPVLHIKSSHRSTRIYRLINISGEQVVEEFYSSDLVTIRDFNKKLFEHTKCLWRGDAKAFTAFQEHLLEITPSASLIEILGWNPQEEFYAFSNGVYAGGKFVKTDSLGVVAVGANHYFLPAFSEIHSNNEMGFSFERLFRCNPQGVTTLYDFVGQIVKVYGKGGMVGFAWTLAAAFRDIIFAKEKYFPVLNLFGRKGSGKTELARALSSMFYTLPATPTSCSNTSIPVMGYNLSHARNSVVILDEFTNDLISIRIDLLKGLWGGTARSKMEDGKPITIPVTSGVILAGQYKPEDEAIFSRSIHLMYSQTSFSREEKQNFRTLSDMVLHGNTHLLLQILELRGIFEEGFYPAFEMTLNDVLNKLEKDRIEDRILKDWVVVLAAFRILEPHIEVPFTYNALFDVVVDGIRYQNDQIKKSSDTANFWLFLDSMHTQGKIKEKCHFVIKLLTSFSPKKKDKKSKVEIKEFVEPKRVIFLNFKAVQGLLEQRIARQKTGSTLNISTLESYLRSLPQFLGVKQQRFQNLRNNGELDEEYKTEGTVSRKYVYSSNANALCFDYDSLKSSLDLNLETFRISEDELNADMDEEPAPPAASSDISEPIDSSLFDSMDEEDIPF